MTTQGKVGWTPGPWQKNEPYCSVYAGGTCICEVGMKSNPVAQANARLISKAPEMAALLLDIANDGADWLDDGIAGRIRHVLAEIGGAQ